jgi:hypothetical protein
MSDISPAAQSKGEKLADSSLALGIGGIICGVTALPAVIQSIRALIHLRKENANKKAKCKAAFGLIFSSCILTFIVVSIWSAFSAAQALADQLNCGNNLKQLSLAIKIYANANDDRFPSSQWCDLILADQTKTATSLNISNLFRCPAAPRNLHCSYAMNRQLIGLKDTNQIPDDTVVLFESDAGWNAVGGPEILVKRHYGGSFIVFEDGSIQEVNPKDFKTLRWTPFTNSPAN